jgi:hypothetical protein
MGMLRSSEEYDVLMSLDYQGKGTMQVGGQPCNVTMYRSDISYQTSGERIRVTGTRPNGQSCSTIEVLSGAYAWNEDIQGAELIPGKGKGHADAGNRGRADDSSVVRARRGVQGRIRGTSPERPPMTPRPQRLAADVMTIGKNVRRMGRRQGGVDVPDPGRPHCHGDHHTRRQMDARERRGEKRRDHLRVHVQQLQRLEQPAQSGRGVLRRQDDRKEERHRGPRHHDDGHETGQMYVVMPVPASIKAAIKPTNQPPNWTLPTGARDADCSR